MTRIHTQDNRIGRLETLLGKDFFVLTSFSADEGLSRLFEYSVEALSDVENADIKALLGEKASVRLTTYGGGERHFNGIVTDTQWIGVRDDRFLYRFTLRPWLWLLSRQSDCRLFHNKTVTDIIEQLFRDAGGYRFSLRTSERYPTLDYCVQYRESQFAFVSRLMEKYGIYYYFRHSRDDHELVLADTRSSHDMLEASSADRRRDADGKFQYLPRGGADQRAREHFIDWSTDRRLHSGRFSLDDFDFQKSTANLFLSKEEGEQASRKHEIYDYPGEYASQEDGELLAKVLARAAAAADGRRHADGDATSIFPGALVNFSGHPTNAENGQYLVLEARHSFIQDVYRSGTAGGGEIYRGSYVLLRGDTRFAAQQLTPRPVIAGIQTAIVVADKGSEGEEIDVDEYGRILVRFHWDREEGSASKRIRVAQVWSGKAWGGQFIPRVGQEVVVEFLEGNPDRPLVIGTVYNDQHKLPYDLPAKKTISGLKSETTKNGGGHNELRFDDQKDNEVVGVHAQKDLSATIRHSETRQIGEDFPTPSGKASREATISNGDDVLKIERGSLLVEAATTIELKVGQSRIIMDDVSVTIDTPTLTIKSVETKVEGTATVTLKGGLIKIN